MEGSIPTIGLTVETPSSQGPGGHLNAAQVKSREPQSRQFNAVLKEHGLAEPGHAAGEYSGEILPANGESLPVAPVSPSTASATADLPGLFDQGPPLSTVHSAVRSAMLSASPAREGSAQATLLLSSDGLAPSLEPQPRLPVEAAATGLFAPGAELISASDLLAQTSLATGEESAHPVPGNESTSLIAGSVVVPGAALNGRMTDPDLAGEPFGGRAGERLPQALQMNTLATANGHPAAQTNTVSGLPPRAGQSGVTPADDAVHADGDLIRLAIAEATKAERGRGELSGVNPGAGKEAVDLPELSFESVRVTIRDPGAERAWSVRDPALQLPGPRQPLGHPEWSRALGERLAVVVRGEHQTARMSLNPAHLGPIDIQLRMQDDQAQLWLNAHHPQAREALDLAMPRLREMFAQQGIDLSHQQGQAGQSGDQQQDSGRPAGPARSALSEETEAAPPPRVRESGLLDDYA